MIGPSKVPGKKAGPNGSFPVGDKTHAKLAIPMAERSERAGNISPAQEHHIQAAARKELGEANGGQVPAKRPGPTYPGLRTGNKVGQWPA